MLILNSFNDILEILFLIRPIPILQTCSNSLLYILPKKILLVTPSMEPLTVSRKWYRQIYLSLSTFPSENTQISMCITTQYQGKWQEMDNMKSR